MNNSNKKTISNANGYKNLQSLLGLKTVIRKVAADVTSELVT
jgi:hypothetical protein